MTTRRWIRILEAWAELVRQAAEEGWPAEQLDAALREVKR